MKIGIFGDSFAQYETTNTHRANESWIECLKQKGYDVECHGYGCTSVWYSYKKFLEHYHKYTHIVFSYSCIHRIHHIPREYGIFSNFYQARDELYENETFKKFSPEQQYELKSILDGYLLMKDDMLDKFIAQTAFNNVNYMVKSSGKKIVNLLPFQAGDEDDLDLSFRAGNCITRLVDVSVEELPAFFERGVADPRDCHLSLENNTILANLLLEYFNNDSADIIDPLESGIFIFDKKISRRYFDVIGW